MGQNLSIKLSIWVLYTFHLSTVIYASQRLSRQMFAMTERLRDLISESSQEVGDETRQADLRNK